jgi:hypothetical protein
MRTNAPKSDEDRSGLNIRGHEALQQLTEVRHDRGQKAAKSFRISLGSREVCTTFAIEFEPFGEADAELLQ